jgi:hypothetical protein
VQQCRVGLRTSSSCSAGDDTAESPNQGGLCVLLTDACTCCHGHQCVHQWPPLRLRDGGGVLSRIERHMHAIDRMLSSSGILELPDGELSSTCTSQWVWTVHLVCPGDQLQCCGNHRLTIFRPHCAEKPCLPYTPECTSQQGQTERHQICGKPEGKVEHQALTYAVPPRTSTGIACMGRCHCLWYNHSLLSWHCHHSLLLLPACCWRQAAMAARAAAPSA